ncbi:hypothetical protein KC349_g3640 [Hortaea werneckii]|nr:hypothetical protein KC349_g3640 [Hortaea werneckii]
MSRYGGGGYRASADDLAYGDLPQRWDRDRFERFGAPRGPPPPPGPPRGYHEDYHFHERDSPYRRDVAVADRIDDPRRGFQERDRYWEDDRYAPPAPGRARRRTDRELFGEVDPREIANMALVPARRKSISRPERDIDIDIDIDRRSGPPRPGMIRRQSSWDAFDRRPSRYDEEERDYRIPPYTPVPLPIRRHEHDYERVPYRDYEPEDYREVEIQRERSVHRRGKPKSEASRSEARSHRSSKPPKSVTTRRTSPSSASSESFEEIEKEDSIHDSIASSVPKFKKGKTRMPKRLVMREAIQDLGYPYDEEEDFYVLRIALEKEQIDEVIKISEQYKAGGTKKVYRFEERAGAEDPPEPLPNDHEEVRRTEWINPPTVVFGNGPRSERTRSVRDPSPSSRTTTTRRTSPSRSRHTHRSRSRAHSRRPSSPGTIVQDRRTVIEEQPPPPPPPAAAPIPPPQPAPPMPPPGPEFYEDRRTIIEERAPSRHSGAMVVQDRDYRSDRDIQAEIRALEAERRALKLEREAEERRDIATRIRDRPLTEEEYHMVEYSEHRPRETLYIEERERERSPPRNVIRVEKDRKGRMALVRSAH